MAQDDKSARELEQWRSKYYDTLHELENQEKEWQRTENVLRQCISRLTLAADTSDDKLNEQLDRLRTAIRKNAGHGDLERLIASLSEHLVRLDEKRRSHASVPTPIELLQQLVDGINFPRGVGHKAKTLSKSLSKLPGESDFKPPLQELIALVGEAIDFVAAQSEEEEGAGGKGLFGKLFGRGEKGEAAEAAPAPMDLAAPAPARSAPAAPPAKSADGGFEQAKVMFAQLISALVTPLGSSLTSFTGKVKAARREEDLRAVTAELATLLAQHCATGKTPGATTGSLAPQEVLLQLLERLAVPAELVDRVEAIKGELTTGYDDSKLPKILGQIADLIATMRSRVQSEKAEIENFLKQLTENLKELDLNLQAAASAHRETVEDGRKLDADIKVQVKGIEDSVQKAQSVDQLKAAVQERVDTIRRHMDVFRRVEDERIEKAEGEVEKLKARLVDLERETEGLRSRIEQERNQALIDPLTEIYNRLAYNERVVQEHARWKRYKSPLVFTVWDVDFFKRVNDTYGHQAGDKVLKVVAKMLSTQVRETDFVARYGGEEFIILLPETDLPRARVVTEKIRAAVEKCEFHYRGERVPITISCGMAEFRGEDDPDLVFSRADVALYKAKNAGRNRCVADVDAG